jgi:hypothetical protein
LQKIVQEATSPVGEFAPRELAVTLDPEAIIPNIQQLGTSDRTITESIRTLAKRSLADNPDMINELNAASHYLLTTKSGEETIFRAFKKVYSEALDQANKTTYFSSNRSFFERSINHPFLGFYPYSYMFKKVLPEMTNFLFKKPFGAVAPGAGFQAYRHVRDYVENKIETDYSFRKLLENNADVSFFVSQLFPGVPWDISAMPPSWLRSIARSTAGGGDKNYNILVDMLGRDVIGHLAQTGPVGASQNFMKTLEQLRAEQMGENKTKQVGDVSAGPNILGSVK